MGCLTPIVLFVLATLVVGRLMMVGVGPYEILLIVLLPAVWALVVWSAWFGRVGRR